MPRGSAGRASLGRREGVRLPGSAPRGRPGRYRRPGVRPVLRDAHPERGQLLLDLGQPVGDRAQEGAGAEPGPGAEAGGRAGDEAGGEADVLRTVRAEGYALDHKFAGVAAGGS